MNSPILLEYTCSELSDLVRCSVYSQSIRSVSRGADMLDCAHDWLSSTLGVIGSTSSGQFSSFHVL